MQNSGTNGFKKNLEEHRFWQIVKQGLNSQQEVTGMYDSQNQALYPPTTDLQVFLIQHPFVYLRSKGSDKNLATLQSQTKLLWNNDASDKDYNLDDAINIVNKGNWAGLKNWKLPSLEQLQVFAMNANNPHRIGKKFRLDPLANNVGFYWQTDQGRCDIDEGRWVISPSSTAYIFACYSLWQYATDEEVFIDLITYGLQLVTPSGTVFPEATSVKYYLSPEELLLKLEENEEYLVAGNIENNQASNILKPIKKDLNINQFENLDYTPCRLPKLDNNQLTDSTKGLWELWGQDAASLKEKDLVARDPFKDVQRRAVAIDFGTSSTVVAMDTANGAQELLRIGVRDFYQAVEAKHFENPTVLECLDFSAFNQAWQSQAYRPALNWDWMRVAHEAQASFRDNPGDTNVLASIMPRLKQWALRSSEDYLVRITGRQGVEIEIPHHTERNPVRGQPIDVDSSDIFDPIEIYAWYLGMAINWRGRGLFLKYNLSFPVKYPLEVKNRILASFRRGLQRSLPASLIEHYPQVLNDFTVTDLASEPAAYAASALQHLGVEPTDDGIVYAVFDFGGGTSDFDFGILRWATEAEEDQGYDRVFEHLASSGDNFLGGENLLEHLVYESFKNNLGVLRQERIQFTQPIDAKAFAGSEAFIAATQAAQTNAIMLAAKLRPFMEDDQPQLDSQLKLDLIDANGNKKLCTLNLEDDALTSLLAGRIVRGLQAFLAELSKIKTQLTQQQAAAPIHFLLAGNGSHSRHMQALCDENSSAWEGLCQQAFGEHIPEIIIYPPLPMDEANPYAPTAKTGVALGLLQVSPGKNTLLLNKIVEQQEGQAPFNWYVGRMRRNAFKPIIEPQAAYGEWFDIGPLQDGVFNLLTSSSPRAHTGLAMGDPELTMHPLEFPSAPSNGARLFVRITAPNQLQLAAATEINQLEHSPIETLQLGQ